MRILLLLLSVFLLAADQLSAQKTSHAEDLLKAGKLTEAKAEIDQVLSLESNQGDASAWYIKAKIYLQLASTEGSSIQASATRMAAFQALKKYTETDTKMLIALQIDAYKPINEIYTGFYTAAASSFNAKQYEPALNDFRNAITISNFMTQKDWIKLKLDTNAVLYAGVAAEKLGRNEDALKYYGQLVEAKVKGEGFVEIYKWVANQYFEKRDYSNTQKFIALGRTVYPADAFWTSMDLDLAREQGDKKALFAQYEKAIAAEPQQYLYRYNYAVELYQQGYNTELSKRPDNSAELIQKADAQLRQVISIKPDYVRAQLFEGQIQYNAGVDILNRRKALGTGADVAKERDALKLSAVQQMEQAIPYFLTVERLLSAQNQLSASDKSDLKEAYDLLSTIYDQKGMADKRAAYEAKLKALEQ